MRSQLIESRAGITQRPSPLDPDVPVSVHPAPDNLDCSCGCNRGKIRESHSGSSVSNLRGCRRCDAGVHVLPL